MRPDLVFFRELRVGDPKLGPDSSTSTYTFVDKNGRKRAPLKLHYKFPVDLYGNASDAMRDHARVHHAIPALNYGLFCERIVYEYPLGRDDLQYLRKMEDVTAREQYLNRFVRDEPHALILPKYHVPPDEFEPEAIKRVGAIECQADPGRIPPGPHPDPTRYAVLSSGGKESLLTYGLLREVGADVTPVYVNESGRHWYTALMAHRYHERTEPRTQRIWSSVDRLYVGANRLLPCVRPEFQRMAADVYPIQLFTFNSYQMAVAGLSMHLGIGTMLMGNEFDEGPWPIVKGVKHWYGIYDQSQEFDLLLNDYFAKKGWGIRQTSLLRTLSGVLIEDILATRYPDLLKVQTSCHATHIKKGKVLNARARASGSSAKSAVIPCGRCSKCQGVILLLLAGGHDPKKLRYRAADIKAIAGHIATTEVKVEQPEFEHAMWLAQKHGWKFEGSANGYEPRPHPEIESIRFHPDTSRRDSMPEEIATKVYRILSSRAKGVQEKVGERWVASSLKAPLRTATRR